jgi:hypothetical protein
MYPRNAASPERLALGQVILIVDGTIQTSGVSITVRGQGGAEGAGGGTTAYGADGTVYYTPTQAETNFTSFVVIAYKAACLSAPQTIITTASATPGKVVLSGETHIGAIVPTVSTVTDGAKGSVCTEARLSELDAANMPGDIDNILGQVTGTGNRVVTINVKDDGANNLQDVLVRIGEASRYTDVSGNAVFALNDGSYDVILRKNLVSFTVPEPLTVAGTGTYPFTGVLIVPSVPTQPNTCVVYGTVIDDGGNLVSGAAISIKETNDNTFSNNQKIVLSTETTSDVNGFWQLEKIRSSQLDPIDSSYEAIITYGDGAFRYVTAITVPDADSAEFTTTIDT